MSTEQEPENPLDAEAASPLAEAAVTSLDELFSRDPLKLSDQDISLMVKTYRDRRAVWMKAEADGLKGPGSRSKAKAKPKSVPIPVGGLDLKDLGL